MSFERRPPSPELSASVAHALAARTREGRWAVFAATSLALVASACGSPDAPAAAALALSSEPLDFTPVMVTSGTCTSKGFRPIDNADACGRAGDVVLENAAGAGQIVAPSTGGPSYGCSIATTLATVNGSVQPQLNEVFVAGNAQQLAAQSCFHGKPCICADDDTGDVEADPSALCRDGQFQPDPQKYYTIRSPNGRFLRGIDMLVARNMVVLTPIPGDAADPYTQPYFQGLVNIGWVNDPSNAGLHWRFEAVGDDFSPINRRTGIRLNSGTLPGAPTFSSGANGLHAIPSPNVTPFTFTCRGSQVFLDQDGFSPVDAGGLMTDDVRAREVSFALAYTEPTSPGFMTRQSQCMNKSRTCSSVYGAGFVQTGRSLCGTLNRDHRLTCRRTLDVPASMLVEQGWHIEEVESFSRAVTFDTAPVHVDPLVSASTVADSLTSFGLLAFDKAGLASAATLANTVVAAGSGPLYGALFSLGVNAIFEFAPLLGLDIFEEADPVAQLAVEIERALVKLAADIDARTEVLINNSLAQESARALSAQLNERRRVFYMEYPVVRATRLALGDAIEVKRLADDVFDDVNELFVDINVAFPTLSATPSQTDLRRAHFALDIAKLSSIEAMIMLSEAILLEAYALPQVSCEQLVLDRALEVRANLLADKLEGAVAALITYGNANPSNRISLTTAEFAFDAQYFSYPIARQLEFLGNIAEETTNKCHRLRDPEDSFRSSFVANTPASVLE